MQPPPSPKRCPPPHPASAIDASPPLLLPPPLPLPLPLLDDVASAGWEESPSDPSDPPELLPPPSVSEPSVEAPPQATGGVRRAKRKARRKRERKTRSFMGA